MNLLFSKEKIVLAACMLVATTVASGQTNQPSVTQNKPGNGSAPINQPSGYSISSNINRIKTFSPRIPYTAEEDIISTSRTVSEVNRTTQYIDGLGRPLQTVNWQNSPLRNDIVSPRVYDEYGRESYKYLPYTSAATDGSFKQNPFTDQFLFYSSIYTNEQPALQDERYYYSHLQYEASPLNRVNKTFAPGNNWAGSEGSGTEHAVQMQYLINDANDAVRIWDITNNSLSYNNADITTNIPTTSNTYAAGQLYKTVTIDEKGKKIIEYKDKEEHVVLKKVQIDDSPTAAHNGWLCTYYVYDDFGLLRFVIPPKATAAILNNSWDLTTGGNTVINELCFRYEYDARHRMIAKKVPGAGWVYMVYDVRDRLIFTQDANMRSTGKWLYTYYDKLNRPFQSGMMIGYGGQQPGLQAWVNAVTDGGNGYFASLPPGGTALALTQTYYDDYTQTSKNYSATNNSKLDIGNNNYGEPLPLVASTMTKGMVTVTRVRVIENPSNLSAGSWLETVNYYDDKGRVVQVQSDNYKGGLDIVTNRYDFMNKIITTYQSHTNPAAGTTVRIKTNMEYDHAERLLAIRKTLNDDPNTVRTIVRNEYDQLGQLKTKQVGQKSQSDLSALETLDYTYNIRGWLQGVNRDYSRGNNNNWFGMELNYDWGFTQNQFNGNIAGMQWRSKGDGERRAYGYDYDNANRLLKADFTQNNGGWNQSAGLIFDVKMGDGINYNTAYDENGNILQMQQWGIKGLTSSQIDALSYIYVKNSNKLQMVSDGVNDPSSTLGDFHYNSSLNKLPFIMPVYPPVPPEYPTDYNYDANGSMISDLNKNISAIEYNHLNLPYQITVTGKGTITYIYDAAGNKLEKRTVDNTVSPAKNTTTSYIGGFVYENNALQFFGHEEGRFRSLTSPSGGWGADYFIKDHLGNTRMVLTDEQQQDVYPVASLEDGAVTTEQQYYDIKTGNIVDKSSIASFAAATNNNYSNNNGNPPYNTNPQSNTTATSNKLYKLNGATGNKTGLGIVLKVMAGDNVSIFGKSYWHSNGIPPNNSYPVTTTLLDFLTTFAGSSAVSTSQHGVGITGTLLNNSPATTGNLSNWLNNNVPTPTNKPKAYINWILFDEQFKPVTSNSNFVSVGSTDVVTTHMENTGISKNGYLYVYCSNESDQDVFFDNLQVIHTRGPLLEETHYYPFGLTMAGISSKAAGKLENRFKYNEGTERTTDLGLNWDETTYRSYDAQIGRFHQIDQLLEMAQNWSPYSYVQNNPLLYNDPFGLDTVRTGTTNGGSTATATNRDGTQGSYVVDPTNPNQLNGTGMSGSSEVTVTSSKSKSTGFAPNGLWMLTGSREWYARSASALKGQFTSPSGIIDYAGGSAARTELKALLRNGATPAPVTSFLNKYYPNINKYNPVTKPTPTFWYANPAVTWGMRGLGLASIAYDTYGLSTNSISKSEFIMNTGTTGAMTFGGSVGFGAGFYFTIGRSVYSFYDNQFKAMSTQEQFKFVNTQMMSGTQYLGH